jgi:superfamily I DNA/RNA helicase
LSTFHSFWLKVLREHIEILGYRKNFTISGESDTRTLVKRVIDDLEGLLEDFSPGIFREQISRMKGNQDTENFAMSVPADEEHEAKIALERMETIRLKTGAANEDFAILYRSNIQSRPYEIALRTAGIPYIVIGGQEFFERSEVRDVIAYLKVIVNPWDKASFLRVVNMPRRGIGDKTLHIIHDVCRQSGLSLGKGMAKALSEGKITGGAEKGIRSFLGSMRDYRYQFRSKKRPFHEILQHLIMTIGLKAELERTSKTPEMASLRWDNIQAIIKSLEEYESTERNPTLGGFLDQSSLTHDADRFSEDGTDRSVVTLMTIHSAKGLEFPYVFLVGA